ncbi:hypothetical protein IV454_13245 [Massilia antarctica]|uniref:DUF3955 domain-containing protein n=1 Tax=Massilia antarctica TaxID=2765360 RepID=A0AA48WHA2_9BURK|nr:hypothetical protein [Massilia antarctica]QPI52361.1 hypothetical protein IV454_13245 [Massilia antarctica]
MKLLRILGLLFAAAVMVGFGLCGVFGVMIGIQPGADLGHRLNIGFFLGLAGLAICGALAWYLGSKVRKAFASPRE